MSCYGDLRAAFMTLVFDLAALAKRRHRRGLVRVSGVLALLGAALGLMAPAEAAPPRYPLWPTEIERVAEPLLAPKGARVAERQRIAAIGGLAPFATELIAPVVERALRDPSVQVRREALRLCFERQIRSCVPTAATIWATVDEPTLRIAALRVLSLDPGADDAAALLAALRDPSEVVRAQAAEFLGTAPLPPDLRASVRRGLLAKLADVSITVRRRAVHSLGLLGPGHGTLTIARLLSDPEPTVRTAAADALGRYRDPDAAPALRRALSTPNESMVGLALVSALAVLPDPSIDADLLALLDDPPPGLSARHVARAIGRRTEPGTQLAEGLIARLDEPASAEAALQALLLLGEAARPAIEATLERGVAPHTQTELRRLAAAWAADDSMAPAAIFRWPEASERRKWRRALLSGDALSRRRAAWALAQVDSRWAVPHAVAELSKPGPLSVRRSWAMTLAATPDGWQSPHDGRARARLFGWARDVTVAASDRCIAVAALGAHATPSGRRTASPQWADLRGDRDPTVRACVALALGRAGATAELAELLVDPVATVRSAAALGLCWTDPTTLDDNDATRLAVMAQRDPSGAVRATAAAAVAVRRAGQALPGGSRLVQRRVEPYRWSEPGVRLEVESLGQSLWLPSIGHGAWRWALVPPLRSLEARRDTVVEPLPRP